MTKHRSAGREKTNPIYSYCVLRAAYREMESVLIVDTIATDFRPHNDVYISAPLRLSALVADCVFEKTEPICDEQN